MKILIPLTQGKIAIIDEEDWLLISAHKWCAQLSGRTWYATTGDTSKNGYRTSITMHRLIMSASNNERIDHKDGDGLHNWRSNLRIATPTQNGRNRRVGGNNKSGFKGVYFLRERGYWCAQIRVNHRAVHLGCFNSPELAAIAYDKAAIELFGEFAAPNLK